MMFHIGDGASRGKLEVCNRTEKKEISEDPGSAGAEHLNKHEGVSPHFSIHFAESLNGPWTPYMHKQVNTKFKEHPEPSFFTYYKGVDNVGKVDTALQGISLRLYQKPDNMTASKILTGTLTVQLTEFQNNPHRLHNPYAWDACLAPEPRFDNGVPLVTPQGSNIGAFELICGSNVTAINVSVRAGNPCDLSYSYSSVELVGPFSCESGRIDVNNTGT